MVGSINSHRNEIIELTIYMSYVLPSCGLFSVQFVCSLSRIARYTPLLSDKLPSKIASQSDKANL